MTDSELVVMAIESANKAYAPYSGYNVGAALLCRDGTVYSGCNIENASYPASICAERSAVSAAISSGNTDFIKIAVVSSGNGFCFPCGICRQVLNEFNPDMPVLCADNMGNFETYPLKELLPHAFGSKNMKEVFADNI